MASADKKPSVLSIALDSLIFDKPVAFPLYYRTQENKLKKLIDTDASYTHELHNLLEKKAIKTLYIAYDDKSKYQLYLESVKKSSGFFQAGYTIKKKPDDPLPEAEPKPKPKAAPASDMEIIQLKHLCPDEIVDFPVYYMDDEGETARLLNEGERFDIQVQEKVRKQDNPTLLIKKENKETFKEYRKKNTPELLISPSTPLDDKARMIHTHAVESMENLFDDPKCSWSFNRAKSVVEHIVDVIQNDSGAIKAFTHAGNPEYRMPTHSFDVAVFAVGFGKHLGFTRKDMVRIGYAGIFHDIGKSCVDNKLLDKNGPLDMEEFEVVKKHALYSNFILRSHSENDKGVLDGVKYHHECFDGTGYPERITGKSIPLFAQIISIADVYDAVTSKKTYRDAYTSFESLAMMTKEMGHHFDKRLLMEFIKFMGPQYK